MRRLSSPAMRSTTTGALGRRTAMKRPTPESVSVTPAIRKPRIAIDANKDHKCDICDYIISECADDNKDHKCDYCGKKLTEHTGGKATCKDKAKCEVCGAEYGELDAKNHTDLKHFPATAATKTAEGNIEYWYCSGCKKYYKDATATQEIKQADTVTAKLSGGTVKPGADKSPQTGDNSNLLLWIALLFVSGGAAIGTTVVSRKKKYNR